MLAPIYIYAHRFIKACISPSQFEKLNWLQRLFYKKQVVGYAEPAHVPYWNKGRGKSESFNHVASKPEAAESRSSPGQEYIGDMSWPKPGSAVDYSPSVSAMPDPDPEPFRFGGGQFGGSGAGESYEDKPTTHSHHESTHYEGPSHTDYSTNDTNYSDTSSSSDYSSSSSYSD